MTAVNLTYGESIRAGFYYLLENHPDVLVLGQGLWSPWYVGSSMTDLEKVFGKDRVIDTPVSEAACTGAAVGAGLAGLKTIVVHPRIDFLLYAIDPIVNQAAKWSHMFGGQDSPNVTIRAIINRGGQQGAQHSQALHSWFAHIPGLHVLMPSSVSDARDLLISATLFQGPVIYIDDRWLYDQTADVSEPNLIDINSIKPRKISSGDFATVVSSGYSSLLCSSNSSELNRLGFGIDLFDLRKISNIHYSDIIESVSRTGRLLVVDGGWSSCGLSAEIIASVVERIDPNILKSTPRRLTLPNTPAPCSPNLEKLYYPGSNEFISAVKSLVSK